MSRSAEIFVFAFNIWQSTWSNRVVEGSILLGCDAAWKGNWFPTFRCASWNVLNQLPRDAASLPRRLNTLDKFFFNLGFGVSIYILLVQCFSNWVPRNLRIPERAVRGSEIRKYVMAEPFYLRSYIFMYELKLVWRLSTLIIPLLIARRQSIAASIQKLHDSAMKSVSRDRHREGRCVNRNDQVIDQFEVSRWFLTFNVPKRSTNARV
jgi:hypothetical protein